MIARRFGLLIVAVTMLGGPAATTYPPQPGSMPPPPETFGFRYGINGGRITDVEVTRSDGTRRWLTFSASSYTLVEQRAASDGLVTTTTYLRHEASNVFDGVDVVCTLPSGAATTFQGKTGPGMRATHVAAAFERECRTPFIPDGSP